MFRILFVFFIIVPIIEIAVIMQVGEFLGVWPTVAIVILTAWFGAKMVREQGIATLTSVQAKIAQGEMPSDEIFSGLLLLIAGVLLVTPGFVTDSFGIALLIPKVRMIIANYAKHHVVVGKTTIGSGSFYEHENHQASQQEPPHIHHGNTIEGEYEKKE